MSRKRLMIDVAHSSGGKPRRAVGVNAKGGEQTLRIMRQPVGGIGFGHAGDGHAHHHPLHEEDEHKPDQQPDTQAALQRAHRGRVPKT